MEWMFYRWWQTVNRHRINEVYWEMGKQTAVRRGNWKLVLNGQLVEGAPPEDDVHLANLETDMGETENLKDEHPELTAEIDKRSADMARRY